MFYKQILRRIFFLLTAEKAHYTTFALIKFSFKIPTFSSIVKKLFKARHPALERKFWGIRFPNPVGLAAGFDKDAKLFKELADFGFGFIEIGTLTPKAQSGNTKPRLFRLKADEALINRMGFNNDGVEAAIERLKNRPKNVIVGGNIGKNKLTPNEQALDDYLICFEKLFPYVDYFVVNVSSPNTPNLRDLQEKEPLKRILLALQQRNREMGNTKPILLKIAPDLTDGQLNDIIEIVKEIGLDGLIATNTTIARDGLKTSFDRLEKIGAGGLSGKPLRARSTEVLKYLRKHLGNELPIISVGGIHSAADALEKLDAGASLIQLYTGFVYEGPSLIKNINLALIDRAKNKKNGKYA